MRERCLTTIHRALLSSHLDESVEARPTLTDALTMFEVCDTILIHDRVRKGPRPASSATLQAGSELAQDNQACSTSTPKARATQRNSGRGHW